MPRQQRWYNTLVPIDDRALVAALVAGDPDGLRGVYRAYADRVYTLCHRLLGDPAAAADACHDAFLVASQRAHRLPEPHLLPAWLLALARSECLRRLNGPARRSAAVQPDPQPSGLEPAPELLWSRLELYGFDPDVAPEREAIVRRAGRLDRSTGFPVPWHVRRRRRLAAAGVAVLALVVLVGTAGAALRPDDPDPTSGTLGATPTTGATGSPSPGRSTSPSPTRAPSPTPSPTRSPSPSPPLSPSPSPARQSSSSPAALTVEATAEFACLVGGLFGYRLEADATASRRLDTASLHVATGGGTDVYEMAVDGRDAAGTSDVMGSSELQWWVEVTGADGQPAETAPAEVRTPCAG